MAEETQQQPEGQQQGVQILVDERDMKNIYVNAYRFHTAMEEVALDLVFSMPNPNPQGGQQQLIFKVLDRVVMNYGTAKRLSTALTQLIKRYEQQFGEIATTPAQRAK